MRDSFPNQRKEKPSCSHIRILYFSFDGGAENVTEWHWNWSLGLILGKVMGPVPTDFFDCREGKKSAERLFQVMSPMLVFYVGRQTDLLTLGYFSSPRGPLPSSSVLLGSRSRLTQK